MSIHFVDKSLEHKPPTTQDDFYLRAAELDAQQVDYLNYNAAEPLLLDRLPQTWRLATVAKAHVFQGRRRENALWRVWFQAKFNLSKISPDELNWDKSTDVTTLWGPLVISEETCHSKEALIDGVRLSSPIQQRPQQCMISLPSPARHRSVLRVPSAYPSFVRQRTLSPSASISSRSPSCSKSASPSDISEPPQTPPVVRHVAFHAFVTQAIIRDHEQGPMQLHLPENPRQRSQLLVASGDSSDVDMHDHDDDAATTTAALTWIDELPPTPLEEVEESPSSSDIDQSEVHRNAYNELRARWRKLYKVNRTASADGPRKRGRKINRDRTLLGLSTTSSSQTICPKDAYQPAVQEPVLDPPPVAELVTDATPAPRRRRRRATFSLGA